MDLSVEQRADDDPATQRIFAAARELAVVGGKGFAAPRILAALSAPDATARDVSAMVSHEPGLTARVLKVANSALYGARGGVATVDRALRMLGFDAVRGIAAAACFSRAMPRSKDGSGIDPDELHRHSIAAAVAAEALAKVRHGGISGEAFIAGLLHDVGVLIQMKVIAIEAQQTGRPRAERQQQLSAIEAAHEHSAAVALESWGLPASLVASVRDHHHPDRASAPHGSLAALVNLADHVSRASGIGFACEGAVEAPDEVALSLLGLGVEDLDRVATDLGDRVAVLQTALGGA
jgi:HD-like signal output (HDOD) protein